MAVLIDDLLRDWGIKRVLSVTVDNASSNKVCLDFLKKHLISRGCDVRKGEYINFRCTAHIVNLIVHDGLNILMLPIKKVRDDVRFMRYPARLAKFKECCAIEGIKSKAGLCLDVPTRWNSTYLMLRSALIFAKAFERYEKKDPQLSLRVDCEHGLPKRVSTHLHVTSHMVFHEIDDVANILKEWVNSDNPSIKNMGIEMQDKYNKYWGHPTKVNKLVYLAVVLDPRYKFKFMEEYFLEEEGDLNGAKFSFDLRKSLNDLFDLYQSVHKPKTPIGNVVEDVVSPAGKKMKYSRSERYAQKLGGQVLKNDLDIYLSEEPLRMQKEDFDILKWWDMQQCRLPVLSYLARDILALPTSTVPSESAFSAGGRVVNDFRSSLGEDVVEALICGQDWLNKPKPIPTMDDEYASLGTMFVQGDEK